MFRKSTFKNPAAGLYGENYRHLPLWGVPGEYQAKCGHYPQFKKTVKTNCCPGYVSQNNVAGMSLARLSPQQVRTIRQYEKDFFNRYRRSIILVALRGAKF